MPVAELRRICDGIPYQTGAPELLRALKESGMVVGIVSTGLSLLADRVRAENGLDFALSNRLDVRNGSVTGGVRVEVEHGGKDRALLEMSARLDVPAGRVAAVGDTEGDVSMFRRAGWSIAFDPADAEVVLEAGAVVEGPDLRALIPLLLPR
jgi:phosphoserine phosphatase